MINKNYLGAVMVMLLFASCIRTPNNPGREYMPDMVYSKAYDYYSENPVFANGRTAQLPPEGTIAYDEEVFPFGSSETERERAGLEATNPFHFTDEEILSKGKNDYILYCAICHGDKGEGNGSLTELEITQEGGFPPPPSYFSNAMVNMSLGKMYFATEYGKGLMGSYVTQMSAKDRWRVVSYIKEMQTDYLASLDDKVEEE